MTTTTWIADRVITPLLLTSVGGLAFTACVDDGGPTYSDGGAVSSKGGGAQGGCGPDFECGDGSCIPKSWACDGMYDCSWGDDEATQLCGGSGGSAGQSAGGAVYEDPCGGVTYAGYCSGDTVVWCQDETVYQVDCGGMGMDCMYDGGIYDCVDTTPEPGYEDPCQGVSYEGYCDGDIVVWCEDGQVWNADCGSAGLDCGWDWDLEVYDCE